jgi:hypothetical protein
LEKKLYYTSYEKLAAWKEIFVGSAFKLEETKANIVATVNLG